MNTYFISDTHLGSGLDSQQRERQLVALLDAIRPQCHRLILLGDMFDFWFSYRHVVPRGFCRLIGKLAQMADEGVEIHYFIGNHDMWVFDYFEKEVGCIMHSEPTLMTIDGKQFLMGHGDGLGHLDKHYDFLKRIFRCRFNQRLFASIHPWVGMGIANRWSNHSRHHHDPACFRYMGDDKEGIVLWCKEQLLQQPIDYCVFGHRHTPICKPISLSMPDGSERTSLYLNVGEWIHHRNYVSFDGSELLLHDLKFSSNDQPIF
ncbi:MAG: UDP-2,3-diacylglucosamine diphosphatase [Bacteroidales bacterium]|nr:UDP-2,3-diacylglucosamine diphosphatase [Bacteroidales bacterium]